MALALHRAPDQAARAAVRRLTLIDFRAYARLRLEIDPRPVVLTGPNGAGKTNLLEAISFLAPGRGLRRARLADVDRARRGPLVGDGPRWLGPRRRGDPHRPSAGERASAPQRADRWRDADSQAALAETLSVVWLTPAMDRLFQDSAGERRRFLDRLVLGGDPAHATQLARYAHALRQRAKLLRAGRFDPSWLGGLERQAAAAGVAIAAARRQSVRGLSAARVDPPDGFPTPDLALAGEVEDWLAELPALEVEERFAEALAQSGGRMPRRAAPPIGPHRSDLAGARPAPRAGSPATARPASRRRC